MDFIGQIFITIGLFAIILIGFGMLTGVKVEPLISTYLNFIVKMLSIVGEVLTSLAIPVLKHIGEKIVYVSQHYLNKENTPTSFVAPSTKSEEKTPDDNSFAPQPQNAPTYEQTQPNRENQGSANPYEDLPKPEIMD